MNDRITTEKLLAAYFENGRTWRRYMKKIYSDWKPGIIKQIVLSGGSEEDANDVFQEGIVEFITNLIQGKFQERSSLKTYLAVICKYMWFSQYKQKQRRTEIMESVHRENSKDELTDQFVIYGDLKGLLNDVFERLGVRCKEILQLWALHYRYTEIVEQMAFPSNEAARKKKHECFKKFLGLIKEDPKLYKELREHYYG
jgi:RNA polymerase sigma factor (sigma-70 family)